MLNVSGSADDLNELDEDDDDEEIDLSLLPDDLNERAEWLLYIGRNQKTYLSPIDISIGRTQTLLLNPLEWFNYNMIPTKIKLSNTGYTVILCANWHINVKRPHINSGPFTDNYVFSQLHFHWGENDMEGSEHSIDGIKYPIEMHLIHYNEKYGSQEEAAKHSLDGLCIVVYMFELQDELNKQLQTLLEYFKEIKYPNTHVIIQNYSLLQLFEPVFVNDYVLYWGSIVANYQTYPLMWMICRQPKSITMEQVQYFRQIFDINGDQLLRNFHKMESANENGDDDVRRIFHINPTPNLISTLLPIRIFNENK